MKERNSSMSSFGERLGSKAYSGTRVSAARTVLFIRREVEDYMRTVAEKRRIHGFVAEGLAPVVEGDLRLFLGQVCERMRVPAPKVHVAVSDSTWRELYPRPGARLAAMAAALASKLLPRVVPMYEDKRISPLFLILPYDMAIYTQWRWEELVADWYIEAGDAPSGITPEGVLEDVDLCGRAQSYYDEFKPDFGWYLQWRAEHPPVTTVAFTLRVPGPSIRVQIHLPPMGEPEAGNVVIHCNVI
jgi:hypothetical protein